MVWVNDCFGFVGCIFGMGKVGWLIGVSLIVVVLFVFLFYLLLVMM